MPTINKASVPDKKCIICLKFKSRKEFPPSAFKRSDYRCTKCSNSRRSDWTKKNPDRARENGRKGERKYLLKWYGITPEWFENKLKEQNNRCAICGCYQNETYRKSFDVDHCHTTGQVRGILCNRCNTGLGQFKDNKQNLLNAINYLKIYQRDTL